MKSFLRETVITLILAIIIFVGLQAAIGSRIIPSGSMEPTLAIGERIITSKVSYFFHEPERGDIIVFHPPHQSEDATPFIKRIIGFPGESVEITDGIVYIHKDGEVFPLYDEPYIKEPPSRDFEGDIIPENEYFVLGDNRNVSGDSRAGWTVPRDNIISKGWLSIWPPDKWWSVPHYPLEEQIASSTTK
ncbi:Signal peptidase IB [subsurface metagenome]